MKLAGSLVLSSLALFGCSDVFADPSASLRPPSGTIMGLPYHLLVNPRDMKVFRVLSGSGPEVEAKVQELIALNSREP